ncbi:Yqey-like protein-domain-containing protein [Nemania serpens]|nr:Yqey-like protein-domain-containing protein [Nemania serpens]
MSLRPSARIATYLLRPRAGTRPPSCSSILAITRSYSDGDRASPPLLLKLKADLKTAMRAKDAARLTVLRGVIASTVNASKTINPIKTDVGMVTLLRKHIRASADARDQFAAAGRSDLVEKEEAQIAVLDEYIAGSGLEEVTGKQLEAVVKDAVAELGGKQKMGVVLDELLWPGGSLEGKLVDRAELIRQIKHAVKMAGKALASQKS